MGSDSTSTSSTSDNRVGAEGGSIAVGAEAQISIHEEFSDNAVAAFEQLAGITQDSIQQIGSALSTVQKSSEVALQAVSERRAQEEEGATNILRDFVPVAAIGVVAWAASEIFKER